MSIASLSNSTVRIERHDGTSQDAWGAEKNTFTLIKRARCRIQPVSGQDAIVHGKPEQSITHRAYFLETPDILAGDRLIFRERTLYVQSILNANELDRHTVVGLEERDQ